jgi:hypothetical protein
MMLALPGQLEAAVNIWLSKTGSVSPGSPFPANLAAVPVFQPYLAGTGTIFVWGRPDAGESLVNLSLNLVAETQPICNPGCSTPNAIAFTSATIFNPVFVPVVRRFEYVYDSTVNPPVPITANRVDGMGGFTVLNGGIPAVGVGSPADSLRDAANNSWLIAQVNYNAFATGVNSETHLYLEIGPIGMNYDGESTDFHSVIFGDASDVALVDIEVPAGDDFIHPNRNVHFGNYDALILPRPPLPGDADRNGVVEQADYTIWRANFGSTTQLAADYNNSGSVDAADYVIWRKYLGQSVGSGLALAAPEPSAAVLVSVAAAALSTVRRQSFAQSK